MHHPQSYLLTDLITAVRTVAEDSPVWTVLLLLALAMAIAACYAALLSK